MAMYSSRVLGRREARRGTIVTVALLVGALLAPGGILQRGEDRCKKFGRPVTPRATV